jgi:hypothetical protein
MKELWCWRCGREVPMLEEHEWSEVQRPHLAAISATKTLRAERGLSVRDAQRNERVQRHFATMLQAYARITGFAETNPNAVLHHRASLYGPPCDGCGKPLRTPRAKFCAACGWRVPPDRGAL